MSLLEVGAGFPYATIQNAVNASPDGGSVRANLPALGFDYAEAVLINNKRIRLFSDLVGPAGPVIGIIGAGGGAAPAVRVTGTGGVNMENFRCANVGSAATYVVEGNVDEDWFSRLIIDGGGTARCIEAQYVDDCMFKNGTHGLVSSCAGVITVFHNTVVNMATQGIASVLNGQFHANLAYNCNNAGLVNISAKNSAWNVSDDATALGAMARARMSLAGIAFRNYAGGDFLLSINSVAYVPGISIESLDVLGNLRLRKGLDNRIYAGCHDPFPAQPAWLTGVSSIRSL